MSFSLVQNDSDEQNKNKIWLCVAWFVIGSLRNCEGDRGDLISMRICDVICEV